MNQHAQDMTRIFLFLISFSVALSAGAMSLIIYLSALTWWWILIIPLLALLILLTILLGLFRFTSFPN